MMEINSIHIYNMFKKLILNKDLKEMLGDYKEIIENISDCDDEDDLADQIFQEINYFVDINDCSDIVNNYNVVKAIKLHNDTFGDIDLDESEETIYKKLAFVIIYEYLQFVDLNFFNQYINEDCNHLIYIDDNEDMFNYIESSIKNHYYNNKFYPIF